MNSSQSTPVKDSLVSLVSQYANIKAKPMSPFTSYYVVQRADGAYLTADLAEDYYSAFLWSARPFDNSKEGLEQARSMVPKGGWVAVVSSRRL